VQWGTGWGEHGFVRIQREKGGHGRPGQCGIARSPSVALGGVLLDRTVTARSSTAIGSEEDSLDDAFGNPIVLQPMAPNTILEEWCVRLGQNLDAEACGEWAHWTAAHKALWLGILGLAGTLICVVWPLTGECRRRRADRRRRRELSRTAFALEEEERSPLIQNEISSTYGTNGIDAHRPTIDDGPSNVGTSYLS
jgi:hypothetical protein